MNAETAIIENGTTLFKRNTVQKTGCGTHHRAGQYPSAKRDEVERCSRLYTAALRRLGDVIERGETSKLGCR